MSEPRLPVDIRGFIQVCIPHVDAAELLLVLVREPGRALGLRTLAARVQHSELTDAALERYLAGFIECGLVERDEDTYRLAPTAAQYHAILTELGRLYNEQPVTLVRMIYAPKDNRLRAFADAFRLKK